MLPGILLSYLAGGFVSGGWGIFTIVVFAGAAKALGLQEDMSLVRLPLHRGFSFVRTALATVLIFIMMAAVVLLLVEQLALEDMAARAAAFLLFLVLSIWPMSRLWPAPALPFVIDASEGSRDFLTKLWVGPGIPTAFILTGQAHRRRTDAVMMSLIYLNIAPFVIFIPSGGDTLPPGIALVMCFGLMPLTVYVWIRASHSLFQAGMASMSGRGWQGRPQATEQKRFRIRDLFQGGGDRDVPSGRPARRFDSSMPIEGIRPGMVVHALRDHRSPPSESPLGGWIIRASHDSEHEGVMAALREGTRTPCLVLRVVDVKLGRLPSRMRELDQWEAGEGDRLVLLNAPMPHAHSCFYVGAVAARPEADNSAGREAFAAAPGTALLAEIIALVSSESGSPAYVRYENGLLTGYRTQAGTT
jgi:hypothetical protein